jgi:flagellar biosynthesis GTPase FlhF
LKSPWPPSGRPVAPERFGVEEYYIYDLDKRLVVGYLRQGTVLKEIENMAGWVSPLLGIRFEISSGDLQIFRPDGRMFATYLELAEENQLAHARADLERQRADKEQKLAEQERRRAEKERTRADEANRQAEQEQQRANSLAEKLRQHGIDPEA